MMGQNDKKVVNILNLQVLIDNLSTNHVANQRSIVQVHRPHSDHCTKGVTYGIDIFWKSVLLKYVLVVSNNRNINNYRYVFHENS